MGQRPSIQTPASEVARRPRTNSDLAATADNSTNLRGGYRDSIGHRIHRERQNGISSGTSSNQTRSRYHQQESTTSTSSSSASHSADEDNRSEEDAIGDGIAAIFLNQIGLNQRGSLQSGDITSSSAPSGSSATNHHGRRSESSGNSSFLSGNPSSLFHNRWRPGAGGAGGGGATTTTTRNHHQRFGGSQRLRGARSTLVGSGDGSSTAANEILASGRLNALFQNLDGLISASAASSSGSMGIQQQQALLTRLRHSLPLLQLIGRDIKCPVCHKTVPSDDVEVHLVMCLTRPILSYNDDVLTANKGECAICLEEMCQGEQIARLPCLCIYHKKCIDEWFKRKNTCPEHPPVEED